jgi:hypothetical protein
VRKRKKKKKQNQTKPCSAALPSHRGWNEDEKKKKIQADLVRTHSL